MKHLSVLLTLLLCVGYLKGQSIAESEVKTADPFILLDGDTYYCYGTRAGNPNKGFEAFSSKDLKLWKREGYVITTGRSLYWAPEVYKFDGKYYMYYSAGHRLYVATANSPLGPFTDVSSEPMLETGVNMIDSSVFTDTLADGRIQQWLFFVEENGGNRIFRAKLNSDHVTVDKNSVVKVIEADRSYERKVGYRCTEGPIVIKKGDRYFLMYSANTYDNMNYCVCVAFSSNLEDNTWTKLNTNPILNYATVNNELFGTGHHGYFYDKEGKCRIVFHAYKTSDCKGTRRIYIGTLNVNSRSISMNTEDEIISPRLYLGGYDVCDSLKTAVQRGNALSVDLNNDGYKDFIVAGEGRHGMQNTTLLFDPVNKNWQEVAGTLQTTYRPALVPCDINLDGVADIVTFDSLGISTPAVTTTEAISREGLFIGRGDGTFFRQSISFVNINNQAFTFNMIAPESADVADFNNDGLPDIVLVGHRTNVQNANVVLLNQGNFTFKIIPWGTNLELVDAVVKAVDLNNDGMTDFIVSGATNGGKAPYVAAYMGQAQAPGNFIVRSAAQMGVKNLSNGTLQIADINDDGFPDLFLQGSQSDVASTSRFCQYVYLNKGNSTNLEFQEDMLSTASTTSNNDTPRIQNSTAATAALIDYDGDGLPDLFLGGRSESYGTQLGMFYKNENGHLMTNCVTSGGSASIVAFPDWNGDGRRDFYNSGYSTDDLSFNSDYKGNRSSIYLNMANMPIQPVEQPVNLKAESTQGKVTLSWSSAPNAHNNTTYEYFVTDMNGKRFTQTLADISGKNAGKRWTDRPGNAGNNKTITLFLPDGNYCWGVQAVNTSYDCSPFSTSTFELKNGIVTAIKDTPRTQRIATRRYMLNGTPASVHMHGPVITLFQDGSAIKEVIP